MNRHRLRACVGIAALSTGALAACVATSDEAAKLDSTPTPTFDGSAGDVATVATGDANAPAADAAVDGGTPDDATPPNLDAGLGTGDGGDAAATGPVDPFAVRWRATADIPPASSYQANADAGVVFDKTTGLTWARRLLTSAELPPDGGDGSPTTQAEARTQCETATLGGTQGWRLPTRLEWLSIVRLDEEFINDTSAFVAADWFGGIPFWMMTNDPTRSAIFDAHYHNFTFKSSLGVFGSASIRCVKSASPITATAQPPAAGRYVVDATTVTDTVARLVWARSYNAGSIVDSQAQSYCANLATASDAGVDAGAKPWRLPTVKEFASLWNEATGLPPELDTGVNSQSYWSGTPYVKPSNIVTGYATFRFTFYKATNAGGDFSWDAQAVLSAARCVRSLD